VIPLYEKKDTSKWKQTNKKTSWMREETIKRIGTITLLPCYSTA
jgi:hypothetical protein